MFGAKYWSLQLAAQALSGTGRREIHVVEPPFLPMWPLLYVAHGD